MTACVPTLMETVDKLLLFGDAVYVEYVCQTIQTLLMELSHFHETGETFEDCEDIYGKLRDCVLQLRDLAEKRIREQKEKNCAG